MAKYEQTIKDLERVKFYLDRKIGENEQKEANSWLSTGLSIYKKYYALNKAREETPALAEYPGIKSPSDFQSKLTRSEIQTIITYFYGLDHENNEQKENKVDPKKKDDKKEEAEEVSTEEVEIKTQKLPVKEASTVPAELNTLVALYKESLTDKIDADETHTVADKVLRARKVWLERHKVDLAQENRLKHIQDNYERNKQREKEEDSQNNFLVRNIDPKAESIENIYKNIDNLTHQAVITQAAILGIGLTPAQINKAVEDLRYLGLTGAVDYTNFTDLNIVTQLAFINQGISVTSPVNNVDSVVQAWQHANEIEPFSEKTDQLEREIILADQEAEDYYRKSTENYSNLLYKNIQDQDKEHLLDRDDLNSYINKTSTDIRNIQEKLLRADPNAQLTPAKATPLELHGKEFEQKLRKSDPTILINPEGLGERAAALIKTTNSGNKNISPEALRLYAIGLNSAKLDELINKDPNSELSKFIKTSEGQSVYQQVHAQLRKIADSKLGQEIKGNIKIPTGLSGSITSFYNSNPAIQGATKLILDPKGTVYAWANRSIGRQIGNRLIKNAGSVLSQKLGNYILEEGLSQGVKTFAKKAAEKLALEAAKKIGVAVVGDSLVATLALALGIPTAGASLIIGAILIAGQIIIDATINFSKKRLDELWRALGWGEQFRMRDVALPAVAVGGVVATGAATAFGSLLVIRRATVIAAVSAVGIIITSFAIMSFYLVMTFLTAPILSTLVQFDSVEKVDYSEYETLVPSSSDCAWPTKGRYSITTGPRGGTHSRSQLEAIDIAAPDGSPHLSGTSGVVVYTGRYSNYGNTVIIQTKNSAGSFKAIYGHLSAISVGKGQQVAQGQRIGTVGGSGGWSPHIHMEYQGIKYNKCPAGGLIIKEQCCSYTGTNCHGLCNAFSN